MEIDHSTRRDVLRQASIATAALIAGCAQSGVTVPTSTTTRPVATGATRRECVSFDSNGKRLFGMVHGPASAGRERHAGVLIMHGLVGSKDQPHRIFVNAAEALARASYVSLRYDMRGRGDSEGESIDITPADDLADARNALNELARRNDVDPNRLITLGMSWGGVLACQLAPDPRIGKTILWSSAPSDTFDWRPKLKDVNGRQAADEWGNLIGAQFYEGLKSIRPLSDLRQSHGPVLIAYGTNDRDVAREGARALQSLLDAKIAATELKIEGADHPFMSAAWERELIDGTVGWLSTHTARDGSSVRVADKST